jgi:hypothetical protein
MQNCNADRPDFQHELNHVRLLARIKYRINAVCSSHTVHLFLTLLSGVFSFLILITGGASTLDTNDAFIHTLQTGDLLHKSSLVSFALITPLLVEGLINLVDRLFRGYDPTSSTKDILTSSESVIFHIGMMLPLIMPFMPASVVHYGTATYCIVRAHYTLVMGIFFASMVRYDPNFVPPWLTIVFYMLAIVASAMAPYQFVYSTTYVKAGTIGFTASIASDVVIAIYIIALVRWLVLTVYRQGRSIIQRESTGTPETNRAKGELRFRIVYVFIAGFWTLYKIGLSVNSSSSSVASFGDREWLLFNIPSIMFQLFFWVLSMRIVRFEAVSSLYALIEAKKQYVRYIR